MKKTIIYLLLGTVMLVTGCADLNHINSFSGTAVKTLKTYDDIGYDFTKSYLNYSLGQRNFILKGDIANNKLELVDDIVIDTISLATFQKADEVITFYITSIASYFEGIAKLSDKDLVNYNFDEVAKNLKANQQVTNLVKINDDQIDAASAIAKVFTNEVMGAYRERKIRKIMIKYDADVSKSIRTLINMISGPLTKSVDNRKKRLESKYLPAFKNPKIDLMRKLDLTKSYQDEQNQLDIYAVKLKTYCVAIKKISDEHTQVAAQLKNSKLTAQQVKDMVNQYGAEVYQLYTNIKTLNIKS